ncbi:hypothetical protein Tco_0920640, partial [Tanacetum coccineum]
SLLMLADFKFKLNPVYCSKPVLLPDTCLNMRCAPDEDERFIAEIGRRGLSPNMDCRDICGCIGWLVRNPEMNCCCADEPVTC